MNTKTTLLCLLAFLCLIPKGSAQCNFGSLNPSQAYTPVYDGNEYSIYDNGHPGEYMLVKTLSTATIYTFKSQLAADYITITDANGAQIFASGLMGNNGINFTPPYPQTVRFYIHANAQCESNPFSTRTRYLKTTTVTYPCDSPSGLSVTNITSNSASLSWSLPIIGINYSYDVYANTSGVAPVANTTPTMQAIGTTAQLSGLATGSTIYYWVRSQCTSNGGIWVPGGSFVTNAATTGCNGAPYGLNPAATYTMACNGTVETISANAQAGDYSKMYVSSGQQYTFSSSVATDYITITDPTGAEVYTSGQSPLTWINNSNWGYIRYYLHTNANCGTSSVSRVKSAKCGGSVVGGCTSGTLYPDTAFTPACTGSVELIVNDAYAGEYANINVTANRQYTFSSSATGDYVTIANPTGNVVLATGPSPLVWNSGTMSGVVKYYLHTNANCGTQNINRQRYITCSNAASACGAPTALSVTNITSNSSRLNWTAPTPVAASYDIYIVTTNTAPTASTTATVNSTTAGVGVLSGLAASTTYYYWIRSNCGTTQSAWVSGGSFTTNASLICNGAVNGLYPDATFTPACSGSNEQIVADAYAGEFSNINILANKQYTFTSSVTTDFITITNAAGTAVLASGTTPLVWSSGTTSGVIRYHLNTNSSCGTQNTSRVRYIKCVDAPTTTCGVPTALSVSNITSNSSRLNWTAPATAPATYDIYIVTTNTPPTGSVTNTLSSATAGVGVLSGLTASTTYYYWIRSNCGTSQSAWVSGGSFTTNASLVCNGAVNGLYPNATFTPACSGSNEQIVADAYAGEYANVNVLANKQYTFTSSVTTDFITITNAAGTTVLASGTTPLVWSSGTTAGVIRYFLSTNANCGTQNTNRVRSIKCADVPVATCGTPSQFVVSNITSTSVRIYWVAPAATPSNYEVYFATSNTAPGVNANPTATPMSPILVYYGYLQPATTYYYWVRSVCGTTKSTWVAGGSFATSTPLTCNGADFGLYPEAALSVDGVGFPVPVVYQAMAGQYSNLNVQDNKQYVFSSSITTDYITITNEDGGVLLAHGPSPLTWSSGSTSGVVRFFMHANGNCQPDDTSRTKYVMVTALGVDDYMKENQFMVYPNPSAGQVTVETATAVVDNITIVDNLGRVISSLKPESTKTTLSLGHLADGVYYVKISYENRNVVKKLVVKKN